MDGSQDELERSAPAFRQKIHSAQRLITCLAHCRLAFFEEARKQAETDYGRNPRDIMVRHCDVPAA